MIDGTYEFEIDTPLGSKPGTAEISEDGGKVTGKIDAPVIGKQSIDGTLEGENAFIAQGKLKVLLMGKIDYTLHGVVDGDSLRIAATTSKGDFELVGTRVS